jgi:hypothetical protein
MHKKFHFAALIIGVFTLYACERKKDNDYKFVDRHFKQKITILADPISKFELDSLTAPLIPHIQLVNTGNQNLLIYLNDEIGALYINDLATKKIVKKITVEGDPLSYKKFFQGFYYHNKDSIFLICYHPSVYLINSDGKILRKYNLVNEKDKKDRLFYRGLYASSEVPVYFKNGTLIISSVVVGEDKKQKKPLQIALNLKTGLDSLGQVSEPESYFTNNYGGLHYDLYSVCFNPKANLAVYSFAASKSVIIDDMVKDSIYNTPAESQYILNFTPYNEKQYADATMPLGEYFMTTPTYGPIYYDNYKDVYYRLALLPVEQKNANYDKKNSPLKPISLVVFDHNFNYLGEKLIEKNKYWPTSAFVSPDGLNIQIRSTNDETLDFTTFKFKYNSQ